MSPRDINQLCFVSDSPIHGQGLFARHNIAAGSWIGRYEGPRTQENDIYVLWVESDGDDEWVGYDGRNELRFLNHASDPNGEMDGRDLYALRDISIGEEITIHYGEEFAAEVD